MQDPTLFQYCPKIIVFSKDKKSVLMARRKGEADYDDVYSFIGGKSETTDGGLREALQREKNEEIGPDVKLKICYAMSCYQVWFTKKSGHSMIIPHHIALYQSGEVKLNPNEYDDYKWVPVTDINKYGQIPANPPAVRAALRYLPQLIDDDFVAI